MRWWDFLPILDLPKGTPVLVVGVKIPQAFLILECLPPFGPFSRSFPSHCLRETPFERVSGGICSKWTKWIKHSPIENSCGIFSPYGKINPVGFFPRGIFHGTANGSENPTKITWGFTF
jgi:hypothetical protein